MNAHTRRCRAALGIAALAVATSLALPSPASAHRPRGHIEVSIPLGDDCGPGEPVYAPQSRQVWVAPVYRTVYDRQWVPPAYGPACQPVWVEPVTRVVSQPVYVSEQYGWRTVYATDPWGRPCGPARKWVVVSPAHYEDQCQTVVVAPGHYADGGAPQVVCPGHWANVERQECVCAGHWEVQDVTVAYPPPARPTIRVRLPF